jgi:hypothetical protein
MLIAQCNKPETHPDPNAHAIAPIITTVLAIMRNRIRNHAITLVVNHIPGKESRSGRNIYGKKERRDEDAKSFFVNKSDQMSSFSWA